MRFGSYSIVATLAGTSILSRRKSMIRYSLLWPPPMKRLVSRPWLLRPPVERSPTVRLFSGRLRDSSTKSYAVWKRRPADVGLNFLTGIAVSYTPSKNSSFSPGSRRTYAFFQSLR